MTEPTDAPEPKNDPTPEPSKPNDPAARAEYLDAELKKWRGRAENSYGLLNTLGVNSAEEATALKQKAAQADTLERERMSDQDKAVDEAKATARAEADSTYRPLLVRARIEAATAGRIEPDRLDALLDPLDMSKFLTDSGDVDTDKVSAYVNGIAPKGSAPTAPRGPGIPGAARVADGDSSVSAGKDLWNRLNPNKAVPTT